VQLGFVQLEQAEDRPAPELHHWPPWALILTLAALALGRLSADFSDR